MLGVGLKARRRVVCARELRQISLSHRDVATAASSQPAGQRGTVAKKLRCYLGLHRFVRRKTDDGKSYKECRDCGKYMQIYDPIPPNAGM